MSLRIIGLDGRPFSTLLGLRKLPLSREEEDGGPFRQVGYIERHLLRHDEQVCRSLAIEDHYIDRDHMEDHAVFYSRSFDSYPSHCRRVHFFSLSPTQLRRRIRRIHAAMLLSQEAQYRYLCTRLSSKYLGFLVLKPLPGCPVGKTVLRYYGSKAGQGETRSYSAAKQYTVHADGLDLTVEGLAFQQQDTGVSACATTAVWTSLQNQSKFEDVPAATPAQVTLRASAYALPFGRAMPSEGLSLDQMCVAVQSFGLAPNLMKFEDSHNAVAALYSALLSGLAPVLVLFRAQERLRHAVTVVGMRVAQRMTSAADYEEMARSVRALYVHDDRNGPYLRANLSHDGTGEHLHVGIELRHKKRRIEEPWVATHALIPMHPKIRLSFFSLQAVSQRICQDLRALRQAWRDSLIEARRDIEPIFTCTWFERNYRYLQRIAFDTRWDKGEWFSALLQTASLPRYVAVVELTAPEFGTFHVLIDSTSTPVNLRVLGLVQLTGRNPYADAMRSYMAELYGGPARLHSPVPNERFLWFARDERSRLRTARRNGVRR